MEFSSLFVAKYLANSLLNPFTCQWEQIFLPLSNITLAGYRLYLFADLYESQYAPPERRQLCFHGSKAEKSRRTVALPPSAFLVLEAYRKAKEIECQMMDITLKDSDLVFCQIDGKPLRPNTVTHAWSMLAVKADVKIIRLHDTRHTHASLMLKKGTP